MSRLLDLSTDWLADAALTDEQRQVWYRARTELIAAREQLQTLETRLKVLESHPPEEHPAVLNRPDFNREVARMLAFDERYGGTSSVLYFDIENLSAITHAHGRTVAATIVRIVSDALVKQSRATDIIGRLAMDEFGVLLTRCPNAEAWKKAEKLATSLQRVLAALPECATPPLVSYGAYTFREKEGVGTGLKQAAEAVTRTP